MVCFAFTLFLLSGCASKADPTPAGPSIVGTWKAVSSHFKRVYTIKTGYPDQDAVASFTPESYIIFTTDGKVTDATTLVNNTPRLREGTYQLDGKTLNFKYTYYVATTAVVDELTASKLIYTIKGDYVDTDGQGNSYPYSYTETNTYTR